MRHKHRSETCHACVFVCEIPIQCEALELPGSFIWRGPICQLEDAACGRGCLLIARISVSQHAANQINFWISRNWCCRRGVHLRICRCGVRVCCVVALFCLFFPVGWVRFRTDPDLGATEKLSVALPQDAQLTKPYVPLPPLRGSFLSLWGLCAG